MKVVGGRLGDEDMIEKEFKQLLRHEGYCQNDNITEKPDNCIHIVDKWFGPFQLEIMDAYFNEADVEGFCNEFIGVCGGNATDINW